MAANYLLSCDDIYQEANRVANKICSLVAGGVRYRDIAVINCDYENTVQIYAQVFESSKIPVNVDVGGKLIEHALMKYLRDVLNNAPWISKKDLQNPQLNSQPQSSSTFCNHVKELIDCADQHLHDEKVVEKITEILETIDRVLGHQVITLSEFNNMFCTLASACKISDVPKYSDRVLVVAVNEYEPTFIPHIFICGATDGAFPQGVQDTDIITEQDIKDMAVRIEPSPSLQLKRSWIHARNIMQSATQSLVISYATTNINGERVTVSPLVKNFVALDSKQEKFASRAFARQRALTAIGNRSAFRDNETSKYFASLGAAAGLGDFKIPQFDNQENLTIANDLFFPNQRTRVTAIENFVKCPYYHFLVTGLGLKKREPVGKISPAIIGTILHEVAEKIVSGEKYSIAKYKLPKHLSQAVTKQAKLMEKFLLEDIKSSQHKPKYFEHKLEKQIDGITVRGIADRIDFDGKGFIVVDYKSGGAGIVRLQVPLYMEFLNAAVDGGYYLSLKDFTKRKVSLDEVQPSLEIAEQAIQSIKSGNIEKCPIHKSVCNYCVMGGMCERVDN